MNLVIALLSTRTFITAERIRETVSGYADSPSDEAFSRMFERDKNELRDLGIPLETGRVSSLDPTEGYRINREAYALPPVELTADEAAAVAVATQLWESPEMVTATQGALLKLRAAGVDVDAPDVGRRDHRRPRACPACAAPRTCSESCWPRSTPGRRSSSSTAPSRSDPYTDRTVEPWGVVTYRGRWYLVGHDRDPRRHPNLPAVAHRRRRRAPSARAARCSRPDGVDLREIVHRAVAEWPPSAQARVWVADGRATALRRQAAAARTLA